MSSPEYLSRLTKKMAAILGGQYNDKEPIFLDDSTRIRTKKKYINVCLFTLRFLALLLTISLIMAAIISLYRYNKGLKKTVIVVDTGCVTCDFLNPTSPKSIEGELKASSETSLHQTVTKNDYFKDGNKTVKEDVTETRNETEVLKLSGRAEVVSENSHTPVSSSYQPPPPPPATPYSLPPPSSPPPPTPPPTPSTTNSLPPPSIPLPTRPSTPSPPPPHPDTPSPPPSEIEERQSDDLNDNKDSEYHYNNNYVVAEPRPRSISTSSVYETVMGYVRPVKDFVIGLVNRFLSLFSG